MPLRESFIPDHGQPGSYRCLRRIRPDKRFVPRISTDKRPLRLEHAPLSNESPHVRTRPRGRRRRSLPGFFL